VIRIRYTDDIDNSPPVPVLTLIDLDYNYIVNEDFSFDGSKSSDPDGDELEFAWDFGDGTSSTIKNPTHSFQEQGRYQVKLVVTDVAGISQQTSKIISVGKPPTVSISSPIEGDEFFVGQIFQLQGEAFNYKGERLDNSSLTWEVRKHHADHFHPFLDATHGNDLELFPAPEPEDFFASTNSYLQIILKATDENGLTTEVNRLVQPLKINVSIESNPPGIEVAVDAYPLRTSEQIVSWKNHKLNVLAKDQPPFLFQSWRDGNTERERKITLREDGQSVLAIYCAQDFWFCTSDKECCSGSCASMACKFDTTGPDSSDVQVEEIGSDSKNEEENWDDFELDFNTDDQELVNGYTNQSLDDDVYYGLNEKNTVLLDDVENNLGGTGLALITIVCGISLVIAMLVGYSMAKRKKKKAPVANVKDDNKNPLGEGDSILHSEDEETGPSDLPNANIISDGTNTEALITVDSNGSATNSDRDVLNDASETSSSSSS
jgi:PKD repeat protein